MINEEQARRYCYQDISLIENYERAISDMTQTWDCHHRVETIMNCGAEELIAQGCYENRPAHDLIFLTKSEHTALHKTGNKNFLGHKHSDKTREKMSAARIGKKLAAETRAKMSESIKETLSRPEVRAKISAANKGKKRSAETRAKISAAKSAKNFGSHWWNNGTQNKFCKECPGEGWVQGRL